MPTGQIEIALDNEHHKTDERTDNLLERTQHFPGAEPTDIITAVSGVKVVATRDPSALGDSSEQEPTPVDVEIVPPRLLTNGSFLVYNEVLEIKSAETYVPSKSVFGAQVEVPGKAKAIAMIMFNHNNGNYKVIPSEQAVARGMVLTLSVSRRPNAIEQAPTVLPEELTETLEKAFTVMAELGKLPKLSEKDAMILASHKHYKGGLYREVSSIRDADTGNATRTLYVHLWPHEVGPWHRDTEEFHGFLENSTQRFARVEDSVPLLDKMANGADTHFKVNLFRLNDAQNTINLSMTDALALVAKLNARTSSIMGEYGQPKRTDANPNRLSMVEMDNVCCAFTDFHLCPVFTAKNKSALMLSATVWPTGPLGLDFRDALLGRTKYVGFAMRAMYSQDDQGTLAVQDIITFDFVSK